MPEGFTGGFSQGMSPMLQQMMYAQALRNSGITNPQTGAPYNADQGGSSIGNWFSRQLGLTRAPYTQANPYTPTIENGGIAPATPGAGPAGAVGGNFSMGVPPQYGPPAPPPAPVQPQRPLPIPPIPPPQFGPPASAAPPTPAPWPPSPVPLNAGDQGSGSLVYQPGSAGYGAFGNITNAPTMAENFSRKFGPGGAPANNPAYRNWFTQRYGMPPGQG